MFKKGSKNADRHLNKVIEAKSNDLKEKEAELAILQKEQKNATQQNNLLIENNFKL